MTTKLPPRILADLVGKPWIAGARGPEAYDCVGLAIEIQRRMGHLVPEFISAEGELHRQLAAGGFLHGCIRIDTAQAGCVVLLRMGPGEWHLGTMIDPYRMIHSSAQTRGAVIEPLRGPLWEKRIVAFYLLRDGGAAEAVPATPEDPPQISGAAAELGVSGIRVIQVVNPLQPSVGRILTDCNWLCGAALDYYLANCGLLKSVPDATGNAGPPELSVSLNGRIVPRSLWELTIPRPGDCIVTVPHVANGSVLRTLAQVAVVAGSIAVAAVTAGAGIALLGMSTALTASVLSSSVAIAGNLLISAFMNSPSQKASSPTYQFDGAHSLARSGTVIPKGYGTFLWGGNIISSFIDVEGQNQYINCLVCFGHGPARSLAGIQINGKDVGEYGNVSYFVRLGTNDQTPIGNFNRIVNGYPQNAQCLAGVPVIVPGTGDLTQILQVDIVFPDGVWVLTNDNNLIPATITYLVEYAPAGTGSWQPVIQPLSTFDIVTYMLDGNPNPYPAWCAVATDMPPNSGIVYATDNGPHTPGDPWSGSQTVQVDYPDGTTSTYTKTFYGEWQRTVPGMNLVGVSSWTAGYVSMTACSQQTQYQRTSIYGLAPGKYDVRITKYGSARWGNAGNISEGDNWSPQIGQDLWVHSVNEISLLDLAYPNMILVGVRALATGQLSGSSINITAVVKHGLRTLDNNVLPGALQAFEEDNPACVAADMMLDGLYGGGQWPGITAANIDRFIDEWVAWAELNDELIDDGNGGSIRRHVFNGVFDNESNLWDQLNVVGRMSRAQIIPLGRDYGVFLDQPDTPCQIFSVGNIVQDSFNDSWMELDSRANQVEIQFADSTRYYKQDNPIAYMDPANQNAGVPIKNVRIDGKGITVPAQAWHLARFKERCNQFLLQSGAFKCDVDAVACRPGNVAILQHDVPQWGWGGRTLPNSTATSVFVDRDDLEFEAGTSYNLIVLFPSILRYSGTVTAVAPVTDLTGATLGTQLTLSSFDNANRVTRAVVVAGGASFDCPITSSSAGLVVVQPIPGFTPAPGQTYQLFDTDVMETATVVGISAGSSGGTGSLTLGTPLSQAPEDYSTYFYGPVGSQKLVRITNITKASEFRAKIEWLDYDADAYTDATPIVGETSAQRTSNPGVTNLSGVETIARVAGSYVSSASLTWKNGPDTMGVGIYATYLNGSPITLSGSTTSASATVSSVSSTTGLKTGMAIAGAGIPTGTSILAIGSGTLTLSVAATATASGVSLLAAPMASSQPQMVARLTNQATRWAQQVAPGQIVEYTVVGFDINDNYASFKSAPTAVVEVEGIATNLLLGSTFQTGFAYWSTTPRAGDTLAADLGNDGEATYTVASSALTAAQPLLFQIVSPAKWAVGEYLMLSAFIEDVALSTPDVGSLMASIVFLDSSGSQISKVSATMALGTAAAVLNRYVTASTQIPAGTVQVAVVVEVGGGGLDIQVGSILTFSHLLLEISTATQTLPSLWADIDTAGNVEDFFTTGSSAGLRAQGSVLPIVSGSFSFTYGAHTITVAWTGLAILWPDGGVTYIQDGSLTVWQDSPSGPAPSGTLWSFFYWDIVNAALKAAVPTAPTADFIGLTSAAYDPIADAACSQDRRVNLTPGGLEMTGTGTGGGRSPLPVPPVGTPSI